jgi:CheY-like chemotaxis protein
VIRSTCLLVSALSWGVAASSKEKLLSSLLRMEKHDDDVPDIARPLTKALSIHQAARRSPMSQNALIQHRRPADSQQGPDLQTDIAKRLCPHYRKSPGDGALQSRRFSDRHVMLVQSDAMELRIVAEMIRVLGYRVTPIKESGEALLYFGREPCEVVISELDMPRINGYQLAQRIRRRSPSTRILVMTACCQAEVVGYMEDRLVDGWLFKPFGIENLKNRLESTQDSGQELRRTIS